MHPDGNPVMRKRNGTLASFHERNRAIASSTSRVLAWLTMCAAERNLVEDPVPILLQVDVAELVGKTARVLAPTAFKGPFVAKAAQFPHRPSGSSATAGAARGDPFAPLTQKRRDHRDWGDRMEAYLEKSREFTSATDEERANVQRAAQTLAQGPFQAVSATLDRFQWPTVDPRSSFPKTFCSLVPDSGSIHIDHQTTIRPHWRVYLDNQLPIRLVRESANDDLALVNTRRSHAAALWLIGRVAFAFLPQGGRITWQSDVRGARMPKVRTILSAAIHDSLFQADEPAFLGALDGGSIPRLPWLSWSNA
jgi:hypothetical protein